MNSPTPKINRTNYNLLWRWHFYAGLFVVPFLIMLSVTGILMMIDEPVVQPLLHKEIVRVTPSDAPYQSWEQQRKDASEYIQKSDSEAKLKKVILPRQPDRSAQFIFKTQQGNQVVYTNPFTGQVLGALNSDDSLYSISNDIHGSLLIGKVGDALIELATGLMLILIITGVYLWWVSSRNSQRFTINMAQKGRAFWRNFHSVTGAYTALFLIFFVVTGLAWAGIWGAKIVQPWSSFPDGVYANVPKSDLTHADLNTGNNEEVPWNLEQTALPASGSNQGITGIPKGQAVTLDSVIELGHRMGMKSFRLNVPQSKEGVYSLMAATMSGDIINAGEDRALHVDQYTGKILGDVGFEKYSLMAKPWPLAFPSTWGAGR